MKTFKNIVLATVALIGIASCEKPLEETIYSQLAPNTLFTTEDGLTTVLNSAYSSAHLNSVVASWSYSYLGDFTADHTWGAGGSIESLWVQLKTFTWDANHGQITSIWPLLYQGIRDSNIVLDNIDNENFSATFKTKTEAEAKFIRGWCYSELYTLYGPVPLQLSSTDDPIKAKATDSEMMAQIEADLSDAISGLPTSADFGKGTKGAAMAVLMKHYLNTKQWQSASATAQSIMDLGVYELQPTFSEVFSMSNEGNSEMIWALPKKAGAASAFNGIQALTYPPTYPRPYPNNGVFAARTYLTDAFVDTYESDDERLNALITEWSTADGTAQSAYGADQTMPNKFVFDPNSAGWMSGNDVPIVRYADVLISRAEAMNEVSGPTQAAVDLVNLVRERANESLLELSGLTKESFRTAILDERAREFFHEGKGREDLLRHDLFISSAVARGVSADAHHKLFPIPQTEIDANELLEQNAGY